MLAFTTLFSTLILAFALIFHGRDVQAENQSERDCPRILSRLAWGAEESKATTDFPSLPDLVVICHTVTSECQNISSCSAKIRSIQEYHMDQKHFDDIGYNFIIGEDGAAYEGRGWDHVGAHSMGYNNRSIAIAFIGTFRDRLPDPVALDVARKLINCGVLKGKIVQKYKLLGHRQVMATISPGKKLFDEIKSWPRWTSDLNKE